MKNLPTKEETNKLVDQINVLWKELNNTAPNLTNELLITSSHDRSKLQKLFYSGPMEKLVWEEDD